MKLVVRSPLSEEDRDAITLIFPLPYTLSLETGEFIDNGGMPCLFEVGANGHVIGSGYRGVEAIRQFVSNETQT